ncbi:MAG TPA: class I SAM-dependent methyltransferase [Kofleriaceae bacterium]|nr:class I SAM-dependent methyltransferase [Kofleriaceae bacterium]
MSSSRSERSKVVSDAYAELFEKFPQHGALGSQDERRRLRAKQAAGLLLPLTRPGDRVLEIGCGRGETLDELARAGRRCVGMEPSRHMVALSEAPSGVPIMDGTADKLDFPDGTFDLVFSLQVLEHLHPDDVPLHFAEAFRVLKRDGLLAFETPNRRTGPHDVSRGFSASAEGLHLKEWSLGELIEQLRAVGFVDLQGLVVPPFLARRVAGLRRISRTPIVVSWAEDLLLSLIPGMRMGSFVARVLGLEDLFVISRKP